jgi:hypothetical protein
MVDMPDSKSGARKDMSVRVRPPVPKSLKWGIRFKGDMSHGYLSGFQRFFEKQPDIAARVKGDNLAEADLFYLNDYCRSCNAFTAHPFEFRRSTRLEMQNTSPLRQWPKPTLS